MPPTRSKASHRDVMTFAVVCELARGFPGVEEGPSFGTPGLKVKGKFLARLKEDGETLVLRMDFLDRDFHMRDAPETFYITDHYRGYPAVLIRLAKIDRTQLAQVIEDGWRLVAPKKLVHAFDAEREGRPPTPRKRAPRKGSGSTTAPSPRSKSADTHDS